MGHTTDELIDLARRSRRARTRASMDMLLTAGERISMALVSMAINDLGHEAVSFTGSQAGILTDTTHGKARIVEMRRGRVHEALDDGQDRDRRRLPGRLADDQDVTTLGRGGSDTTAVALAAALDADVCEIYTDVDGVYTADPRIVPNARKLHQVSFEEMLDLAASGARVLALRSVEYARNHGVKIHVRSSFNDSEGTWIVKEEDMLEQAIDLGDRPRHGRGEGDDPPRSRPPGRRRTHVPPARGRRDQHRHDRPEHLRRRPRRHLLHAPRDRAGEAPSRSSPSSRSEIGAEGFSSERDIAKISVVGAGMRTNPGVAAAIFEALADAGINIEIISTSSIRVSCVVPAGEIERAVNVVHERLKLEDVFYEDGAESAAG